MADHFPLATMDALNRVITYAVLSLAPGVVVFGLLLPPTVPVLIPTALLMALVFGSIALFARPTRFEISDTALIVRFPLWRRKIRFDKLTEVQRLEGWGFRDTYGLGFRIGAGGLFGTFGLWVTPKGRFEVYRSRLQDVVVIKRTGSLDLLLSPEDAEAFVAALAPKLTK